MGTMIENSKTIDSMDHQTEWRPKEGIESMDPTECMKEWIDLPTNHSSPPVGHLMKVDKLMISNRSEILMVLVTNKMAPLLR